MATWSHDELPRNDGVAMAPAASVVAVDSVVVELEFATRRDTARPVADILQQHPVTVTNHKDPRDPRTIRLSAVLTCAGESGRGQGRLAW